MKEADNSKEKLQVCYNVPRPQHVAMGLAVSGKQNAVHQHLKNNVHRVANCIFKVGVTLKRTIVHLFGFPGEPGRMKTHIQYQPGNCHVAAHKWSCGNVECRSRR